MAAATPDPRLAADRPDSPMIDVARVMANDALCREHFRLVIHVPAFPAARAGQFVQLTPAGPDALTDTADPSDESATAMNTRPSAAPPPFLPRAFSIGGLRRDDEGVQLDVIYRVVGVATAWMASLGPGTPVQVTGPLGQPFPLPPAGTEARLVMGGVGLPPLLWFAERLAEFGIGTVAYLGAQSRDFIPCALLPDAVPDPTARSAGAWTQEFAERRAAMVISTDDGTLGMRGNVVDALRAYDTAHPSAPASRVIYTCGPERMMRAVAGYCASEGIRCLVCMERPMACGVGTCQSCIVTVRDDAGPRGWRYALCCQEGPVFDATQVIWDDCHT